MRLRRPGLEEVEAPWGRTEASPEGGVSRASPSLWGEFSKKRWSVRSAGVPGALPCALSTAQACRVLFPHVRGVGRHVQAGQ